MLLWTTSLAATAVAQSTVVLETPNTEVVDTVVRGGDYAHTVGNSSVLATKANSNSSYVRRALLKFDTENRIPSNATIQSAILTLTLKSSESSTRTLSAYRVTSSFDEGSATWYRRKSSYNWTSAGGDLGQRYAQASVGTSAGSKVTFDITSLVQSAVNGSFGSRYTRVALVDAGSSSSSSLKEFYSSESSSTSSRPKLTVVYGSASPPATPPPSSSSGSTIRFLHWNTHYGGIGTDGRYDPDRVATWIARMNPDVISLNEIEKYVSGHGNENQPARYAAMLKAKTGRTYYYHHAQRYGNWGANGGGNLIMSRFPFVSTAQIHLTCSDRSAALGTIVVNGRNVNVVSTHIDSGSSSCRLSELRQLLPWLNGFSNQRIVAGDMNASINLPLIWDDYTDGWLAADAIDAATDYPGNSRYGATHSYRIDYISKAKEASYLVVKSARVYDTRDANGVRPSDHKPLVVTFEVR